MYQFLLVVHALIAAALVTVILMQRSEGGGLAGGGSPTGMMSARGAADFLTRATTVLAILFVLLSIALAAVATINRSPAELDTSLARQPASAPAAPAIPLEGQGAVPGATAPVAPAPVPSAIPLGGTPAPRATQAAPRRAEPAPRTETPAAAPVTPPPVVTPSVTPPPVATTTPAQPATDPAPKQ